MYFEDHCLISFIVKTVSVLDLSVGNSCYFACNVTRAFSFVGSHSVLRYSWFTSGVSSLQHPTTAYPHMPPCYILCLQVPPCL